MSGAAPVVPTLAELRQVEREAVSLGGAVGATVLLCTRTLCLPFEAVAMDLEAIDWRNGRVEVPARGGRCRILSLPNDAMRIILDVAGSAAGTGQAVTAGRGPRLTAAQARLDRLQDSLADAVDPDERGSSGRWNFHGIRAAGASALLQAGTPRSHVAAALGTWDRGRDDPLVRAERALAALERWCGILGGMPSGLAVRPTG